ncbi:MAG: 1,2-phenylacetyl-CoA epoxidase subunit PaaC [Sulfobacillus sp.]
MDNLLQGAAHGLIAVIKPIADDEWILGHRGSEWLALAPDLEGDMALSSISQDNLGHAHFYYELLHSLGLPPADEQVYLRTAAEWTNAHLLEVPNHDWAGTIALRYLYQVFDDIRHEGLLASPYQPLTDGVRKIRREAQYHLQHFQTGFEMLAIGTDESRQRLIEGVNQVWEMLGDLFSWGPAEAFLPDLGLQGVSENAVKTAWMDRIGTEFRHLGLPEPAAIPQPTLNGRLGQHSEALADLLDEMTEVRRIGLSAPW